MGVEKGFMQAICETPDDDGPRLIFADWLEDNGQAERAEFIRSQCRRAKMNAWDDGYEDLVEREEELLNTYSKKWDKATAKITRRVEWRRGFVEEVALPVAKFLANADALFAATPLTALRPAQVRPAWEALLASVHLARLRVLALYFSNLGVGRTRQLAACEHLSNLHELNVGVNQARRSIEDVVRSPHLGNLRRLKVNKNETGDGLVDALAAAKHFSHLRLLDAADNRITLEGARRLARVGWLGQLESLNLAGNRFGDAGLEALASSDVWANLRVLHLHDCSLGENAGRLLAGCRRLGDLRVLAASTQRNQSIVGDLARSPYLHGLRTLDLQGNYGLSADDADALVHSPMAPNLRMLRIRGLTPAAAQVLLTAPSFSGLTDLTISIEAPTRSVGPVGKLLREATHLNNLRRLHVSSCHLGDEGLIALADSPHLAGLRTLDVGSNDPTAVGLEALAKSPHLNRLRELSIGWSHGASAAALKRLQERYGDVNR